MAASFMSGAMTKSPSTSAPRRSLVVAKASEGERVNVESMKSSIKEGGNNGRRDLVFAGAAIAACSIANIAFADEEEPPRGSAEAKKKYNVICVTMPTARVCRK